MNITPSLHSNSNPFRSENRAIYKFISTISSLNVIKTLSSDNQLIPGMKQRRAQLKLDLNTETYKNLVYPKLGITSYTGQKRIEKKQSIALQYAQILKKYKPDNSGNLHKLFNYLELVSVIKKAFKQHVKDAAKILYTGIEISIKETLFYAKVNAGKVYIITALGKPLGEGTTGTVCSVFEIATCQFVALKFAKLEKPESIQGIQMEIANLNKIQKLNSLRVTKLEGLQDTILADFNLPACNLIGYLGIQYDMDLVDWIDNISATAQERIRLCKELMRVFKNIDNLGLWHGDIKPENIMLKGNKPIVIDWPGALLLHEAATQFIKPYFSTDVYYNQIDALSIKFLMSQKKLLSSATKEEIQKFRNNFVKTAKSLELFSMALTLFVILTSETPFEELRDPELDLTIPQTKRGFNRTALKNFNYSPDIIQILTRMLAHQPDDRYTIEEAFAVWESIDETTGKTRSKTYKIT